jgi:hypothetical protein
MQNWGAGKDDIFDCTLESGCRNVPTCEDILNHTKYAMANAPEEFGLVYDEEKVLEVARNIWFSVQSIIGINEQFQFLYVRAPFSTPFIRFSRGD